MEILTVGHVNVLNDEIEKKKRNDVRVSNDDQSTWRNVIGSLLSTFAGLFLSNLFDTGHENSLIENDWNEENWSETRIISCGFAEI
jgi:hypothetical protein